MQTPFWRTVKVPVGIPNPRVSCSSVSRSHQDHAVHSGSAQPRPPFCCIKNCVMFHRWRARLRRAAGAWYSRGIQGRSRSYPRIGGGVPWAGGALQFCGAIVGEALLPVPCESRGTKEKHESDGRLFHRRVPRCSLWTGRSVFPTLLTRGSVSRTATVAPAFSR